MQGSMKTVFAELKSKSANHKEVHEKLKVLLDDAKAEE